MAQVSVARVVVACVALACVALAVAVPAAPAYAHTALISSEPAAGTVAPTPPAQVALTFNDEVLDVGAQVALVSPSGRQQQADDVTVDGQVVTATFARPSDEAGRYEVAWRVVASDGHPLTGEFEVTVTPATAGEPSAAGPPPTTDPLDVDDDLPAGEDLSTSGGGSAAPAGDGGGSGIPWGVLAVVAAGVLGFAGFRLARRRPD